jgi:hypothetical protein
MVPTRFRTLAEASDMSDENSFGGLVNVQNAGTV